jgi:DNA-binding response OmpR family regulator
MPKLSDPWQPLLGAIVRALRLESFVETPLYAPPDARLVLHCATRRVWLDGITCTVSELHFRLLEILVRNQGRAMHTKDIAEYVARGRQHEDTTRRQLESLLVAIEKSFKAAKRKPPKDLVRLIAMPKLGNYVLRVKAFVE